MFTLRTFSTVYWPFTPS